MKPVKCRVCGWSGKRGLAHGLCPRHANQLRRGLLREVGGEIIVVKPTPPRASLHNRRRIAARARAYSRGVWRGDMGNRPPCAAHPGKRSITLKKPHRCAACYQRARRKK